MNTQSHNLTFLCLSFMFLIGEWGCAHQAISPSPLPESTQVQLGRMGVVTRPTEEQKSLDAHGTGRLRDIGRGAGLGAAMGAGAGAQGGYAAPIVIPVGAALGLVGGAFYGAVASEPWQEPVATLQTIVAGRDLNRALPNHLGAFAQSHSIDITPLTTVSPELLQKQSRYAEARRDGFDTVLEVQDLAVNLVPAEFMVNPLRRLILSARAQLIRTADETVLDDRVVTDTLGPALLLNEWTADHAARFRQEVQQASDRLAEQLITEYFMLYPFPERITSGFMMAVHLKGLRPVYPAEEPGLPAGPEIRQEDIRTKYSRGEFRDSISWGIPNEFRVMAQRVDSLPPIMRWEAFSGSNILYELNIWRSGRLGPDALIYSRTNIIEASHKLETALEPSSLYYWSVRAYFSEHGKDRISEWSRRSVKPSLATKILTGGIAALMPDPVEEGFYVFITPSSESTAQKRSTSSSQDEASCPWLQPNDPRWDSILEVQSLKPTLRWDPFLGRGEGVAYDLAVWTEEMGLREVGLGTIVYERQGLTEPSHRIEAALDPATHYL